MLAQPFDTVHKINTIGYPYKSICIVEVLETYTVLRKLHSTLMSRRICLEWKVVVDEVVYTMIF